jgi:hypothetical protein
MSSTDWLSALRRLYPADRIVTEAAELTSYESDALTAYRVRPAAVEREGAPHRRGGRDRREDGAGVGPGGEGGALSPCP